ncbi:hypothetical protein AHAS_Ahas02G0120200 [Arachis hypogaea]
MFKAEAPPPALFLCSPHPLRRSPLASPLRLSPCGCCKRLFPLARVAATNVFLPLLDKPLNPSLDWFSSRNHTLSSTHTHSASLLRLSDLLIATASSPLCLDITSHHSVCGLASFSEPPRLADSPCLSLSLVFLPLLDKPLNLSLDRFSSRNLTLSYTHTHSASLLRLSDLLTATASSPLSLDIASHHSVCGLASSSEPPRLADSPCLSLSPSVKNYPKSLIPAADASLFSPSFPFSLFQLQQRHHRQYCFSILHISYAVHLLRRCSRLSPFGCCKRLFPLARIAAANVFLPLLEKPLNPSLDRFSSSNLTLSSTHTHSASLLHLSDLLAATASSPLSLDIASHHSICGLASSSEPPHLADSPCHSLSLSVCHGPTALPLPFRGQFTVHLQPAVITARVSMAERSKELLHLEHKATPLSSLDFEFDYVIPGYSARNIRTKERPSVSAGNMSGPARTAEDVQGPVATSGVVQGVAGTVGELPGLSRTVWASKEVRNLGKRLG